MEKIEYEQYILVRYLTEHNPGPVLRDIAENRIRQLEQLKNTTHAHPDYYNAKPCIHTPSGRCFSSLKEAARNMRIDPSTLRDDIKSGRKKFGITYYI